MVGKIGLAIVYLISILTLAGKPQSVDEVAERHLQCSDHYVLFIFPQTACIHFNYNDVGLTKAIKMYWAMN